MAARDAPTSLLAQAAALGGCTATAHGHGRLLLAGSMRNTYMGLGFIALGLLFLILCLWLLHRIWRLSGGDTTNLLAQRTSNSITNTDLATVLIAGQQQQQAGDPCLGPDNGLACVSPRQHENDSSEKDRPQVLGVEPSHPAVAPVKSYETLVMQAASRIQKPGMDYRGRLPTIHSISQTDLMGGETCPLAHQTISSAPTSNALSEYSGPLPVGAGVDVHDSHLTEEPDKTETSEFQERCTTEDDSLSRSDSQLALATFERLLLDGGGSATNHSDGMHSRARLAAALSSCGSAKARGNLDSGAHRDGFRPSMASSSQQASEECGTSEWTDTSDREKGLALRGNACIPLSLESTAYADAQSKTVADTQVVDTQEGSTLAVTDPCMLCSPSSARASIGAVHFFPDVVHAESTADAADSAEVR